MKIRPVWIDGRTDTTKLVVAFSNFANAPTNKLNFTERFSENKYQIS